MPSFTANITTEVEVDFEVFCGTCGEGLCGQSEGRQSRNRAYPQVTVEACKRCVTGATQPFEDEIYELKQKINELETQLFDKTEELENYLSTIHHP